MNKRIVAVTLSFTFLLVTQRALSQQLPSLCSIEPDCTECDDPVPFHGSISFDTVWSGFVNLDGDVLIPAGTTVTILPGAQLQIANVDVGTNDISGYNDSKVDIIVQGTLRVEDGGVPAELVSFHSSGIPSHEGDWGGIWVENGGTVDLQWAEIRDAQVGVTSLSGPTTLTYCTLKKNSIKDVQILNNPSAVSINYCTISVESNWGISIEDGGTASSFTIADNTLTGDGASLAGIMVDDADVAPLMVANNLSGFTAPNGYAVHLKQGNTIFKGNDVRSGNVGMYITGGHPVLGAVYEGNQFSGLQTAIWVKCTQQGGGNCPNGCGDISVVARYNSIVNNVKAVLVERTTAINMGEVGAYGYNSIYGNTTCIQNQTTCSAKVKAVGNYWNNSCAAPTCNNPTSGVIATNTLCQPPSQGGPHLPPAQLLSVQLPGPIVNAAPAATALVDIHPNPFNPTTTISYDLRQSVSTEISIYNVSGQLVRKADLGHPAMGRNSWTWDGRDQRGSSVSSGVYFVVLKAGHVTDRKKAVLLK